MREVVAEIDRRRAPGLPPLAEVAGELTHQNEARGAGAKAACTLPNNLDELVPERVGDCKSGHGCGLGLGPGQALLCSANERWWEGCTVSWAGMSAATVVQGLLWKADLFRAAAAWPHILSFVYTAAPPPLRRRGC